MGRLFRHPQGSLIGFKNPTTRQKQYGRLIDEVWLTEPETFSESVPEFAHGFLQTVFVAQLVDWGSGPERSEEWRIRISYYTRRASKGPKGWVFGQYAASMSVEECSELFKRMHQRGWFDGDRANLLNRPVE